MTRVLAAAVIVFAVAAVRAQQPLEPLAARIAAIERRLDALEVDRSAPDRAVLDPLIRGVAARHDDSRSLRLFWRRGLRATGEDVRLRIGGRIHVDHAFFTEDRHLRQSLGDIADGAEVRRARLRLSGQLDRHVAWRFSIELAGGRGVLRPVHIDLVDLPVVGNVRVGLFTEPMGLERNTSTNDISFLERGVTNALQPGRNVGIMVHRTFAGERVRAAAGLFRDSDAWGRTDKADGNDWALTARFTGAPWRDGDAERMLHLGVSVSYRHIDSVRYSHRPVGIAPRLVDTTPVETDSTLLLGAEAALILGCLSVQAEGMVAAHDAPDAGDPVLSGWYVSVSWLLTGESRRLDPGRAAFTRLVPHADFEMAGAGTGAWEITLRYGRLDASDEGFAGGEMDVLSAGVNWYLNANTRVMLDAIWARVDERTGVAGDAFLLALRFQIAF